MTRDLETQLSQLRREAEAAIATSTTLDELEVLRVNYLGKKVSFPTFSRGWAS